MRILVVAAELELRAYLDLTLRGLGYKVELAHDDAEALERLKTEAASISAVLADTVRGALEMLREVRHLYAELPVILISECPSVNDIVMAMKNGAADFLCQPVSHEDLLKAITRALGLKTVELLRRPNSAVPAIRAFWGNSARMASIHAVLGKVGLSDAPVLIQGETGSGKEIVARELHANSPRAKEIFLKLNCAALPSELVESELFGYERGAFTGAFQRKPGIFELAEGGTLLLDEIGDMDVRLQAKLLQVLQDHKFHRIGGTDTIKVGVQVVAATHRDLEEAISERKFREDLYYRLNVVTLHLPPLRERREDIIPLAEFLLKRHAKWPAAPPSLTAELQAAMLAWDWPGNVRELENFVRTLLIFQDASAAARELYERGRRKTGVPSPARIPDWEDCKGRTIPILDRVVNPAPGSHLHGANRDRQVVPIPSTGAQGAIAAIDGIEQSVGYCQWSWPSSSH